MGVRNSYTCMSLFKFFIRIRVRINLYKSTKIRLTKWDPSSPIAIPNS